PSRIFDAQAPHLRGWLLRCSVTYCEYAPCAPRRRPRIWGTWPPNLSARFPAAPLGCSCWRPIALEGRTMDDDRAAVRAVLSLTVARGRGLVETVPGEELERPPAEGEWSAAECLRHVADAEPLWAHHMAEFREGRRDATAFAFPEREEGRGP